MSEDEFWQLIAASREEFDPGLQDGNMAHQVERLRRLLGARPDSDVREFDRVFCDLFWRAYRWDLWAAAYIIGSGCSDDGFTDFRYWLMSMGRDVFERALADPESLVSVAREPGVEDVFFEAFGYIAESVLEERGKPATDGDNQVRPAEPAGEKLSAEDRRRRFPKLWDAFGVRPTTGCS